MIRKNKLILSIIASIMIGMLGVFSSSFYSIADKIAVTFGQESTMVGLLISVFAACSFTSIFITSAIAERSGKKKVLIGAIILVITGTMLVSISSYYLLTLLGLFLMGMGFGPTEAMGSSVLTDINSTQATKWMNISQMLFCIGAIAAPIAAVWYSTVGGGSYNGIFFICAISFALMLVYFSTARFRELKVDKEDITHSPESIHPLCLLKNKEFLVYAILIFLYLGYESIGLTFIKQLFLNAGSTEQIAAAGISAFWISMIAARLIGVFMSGKERIGICFFTPFVIISVILMLSAQSDGLRIIAAFLYGFGCGPVWPMLFVLSSKVFPEKSGTAYAVMMLFASAGHTLFPVLLGSWVGNVSITFIACALLAATVFLGSYFIKPSKVLSISMRESNVQ